MKIIIAGAGVVGRTLAEELVDEVEDIVLIEKDPILLEKLLSRIDVTGLVGNTASYENLIEAGVEDADIFIAVTSEDEINLISAIMAKRLGARYTIVRVRNPEYTRNSEFMRRDMGISMMINPEWEVARDISRVLRFPESLSVEYFVQGQAVMLEMKVEESGPLSGLDMTRFGRMYKDILVCTVIREEEAFVPTGATTLQNGDTIFVIGTKPAINTFYIEADYSNDRIENAMILGHDRIVYYLINLLEEMHIRVKVISDDYEKAKYLSEEFPHALIVLGDATDQDFLQEERINRFEAVITLSDLDEENILNSIYAISLNIPKVVTRVSRVSLLDILTGVNLQTVVTPKYTMANRILRFVRSLKNTGVSSMEALLRIANNEVEVMQFLVKEGSEITNIPLRNIDMKSNTMIAFIVRDDDLLIPTGNDSVKNGDHVIVVTTHRLFDDIDDVLEGREVR